jgi:soluble cytochrome b562
MDEPIIKTSKFWNFISKRMNAEAALADWRLKLGDRLDFAKLQRHYLIPTGEMANLITCPEQCNPSCGFRKVCEWEGKYEAVCRKWPLKSYEIEKADALFFTIKPSGLLPEITKIFKIIPHIEEFGKEEDTWKLGVVPLSGGKSATVYLTLKIWNHEIMDLIYRINSKEQQPYILLVTSWTVVRDTSEKILKDMGAAFVPLNEVLNFNAQTEFELLRECNLAQLVAAPSAPEPELEPENIFRKCGDAWEVRYQGGEKFILTNCNTGAAYLHFMLELPNTSTPVLEIMRSISGESEDYVLTDQLDENDSLSGYSISALPSGQSDTIADSTALRQYKHEMQSLMKEIAEAKASGDNITVEQLQQDLDKLTEAVNEAVSPIGQKRKFADPVLNFIVAFRNAANFAIDKIAVYDLPLASHLQKSIRYGQNPGYYPDKKITWNL